ncbi:uncharacterized protein CC84DRAFT_1162661 [Paraphaeosphaeria sporulosa]|uniref:Uncharacterized protein n=1 Tax=Paraphaeosphaeria sporulosa TaxID=1460663 RepID=A0A177CPK9_9PLEO|nr:uncharacterized protein CC84DRAFT_1162661 [Paraphaeosphaeria sporulosa]OAG08820.1 hypothetical protein CC84DRAFT_1162661 [Paraphaeosphaeria sporulosa]
MKPAAFFVVVGQMALAFAAVNETSATDETSACVTTTIFTTKTVTVTKAQGSSNSILLPSSTGPASQPPAHSTSAEPVLPTSAPVAPNVTASEPTSEPPVVITSTFLSPAPVAPYSTTNGTWSVAPSHTAPHSSGTGVATTGTASATPPQFTAGVGKMAFSRFALGLVVVGGTFLSL